MHDLLSVSEAARELATHEARVRQMVDSLGGALRVGRYRIVTRDMLPRLHEMLRARNEKRKE